MFGHSIKVRLVNHLIKHSFQLIPGQERVLKISILSNHHFQLVVLQNDNLQTTVSDQEITQSVNCMAWSHQVHM